MAKSSLLREDAALYHPHTNGTTATDTTLQAAITAIGSDRQILFLTPETWILAANLTIPSNIDLWVPAGALLHRNPGVTLTINGGLIAPEVQIFSGTGLTVFGSKVSEVYPQWWGAAFDGTTDDTFGLQAAINTTKLVQLPPGTAMISSSLLLPSGTDIQGCGAKSVIKAVANFGDSPMLRSAIDASTLGARNGNIRLAEFFLDGNSSNNGPGGTNAHALYLVTSQNVLVDHLAITSPKGSGIVVAAGSTPSVFSEDLVFRDNTIVSTGQHGIYLANGIVVRVTGNYINSTGAHGIVCLQDILGSELREITMTGNQIFNCTLSGILAYSTTSTTIIRTTIAQNILGVIGAHGIGYGQCHTMHIAHNSLQGIGGVGIMDLIASGNTLTHNVQIVHNTIGGTGSYGVSYGSVNQATIMGNHIDQAQTAGIILEQMAGGHLSQNTILSTVGNGIQLNTVTGTTIGSNVVQACTAHGLILTGVFACTITGGIYGTNGGTGINESTGSNFNTIVGNYARGNGSTSIVVTGAQTIVDNNQI